jgi:hypothetical protein
MRVVEELFSGQGMDSHLIRTVGSDHETDVAQLQQRRIATGLRVCAARTSRALASRVTVDSHLDDSVGCPGRGCPD